jgi:hypothetical protein
MTLRNQSAESTAVRLGHHHIGDNQIEERVSQFESAKGVSGVAHFDGGVPSVVEHARSHICCVRFVVNHQDEPTGLRSRWCVDGFRRRHSLSAGKKKGMLRVDSVRWEIPQADVRADQDTLRPSAR